MGDKTHSPVYVSITRDEETRQLLTKVIELAVPHWGWEYLRQRADAIYEGDIETAINEVFNNGLNAFFELSEVDMTPINSNPC